MTQKDYSRPASDEAIVKAVKALEKNGFKVEVVDTIEEAKQKTLEAVPKGAEVFTATSVTLDQSGITKEIEESGNYDSVRAKFMPLYGQPDKAVEMRRIGSGAEYALGSVHAVTEDGQVVVASASGSQLPNYVYGASHVIWVVGAQKIVKDLDEAFKRIEEHTFKLEDVRAQKAYGFHSSLNKLLVYRKETTGRVSLIIVKQAIGF